MTKAGNALSETRLTLYVPAGSVSPPATNSNGTFTAILSASWARALMPNPSRQVRVSTTVKYNFFMISPCRSGLDFIIDNCACEVLFHKCLPSLDCQMLFTTYVGLDAA